MSNHFIKPANIARSFARASGMTPASDLKPASWITAEMDLSTGENHIRTSGMPKGKLHGYELIDELNREYREANGIPEPVAETRTVILHTITEKPYRPLVNIRHYGQNSHWSGRGQK